MGRRAIPKIDPEVDLSSVLWPLRTLTRPWDSAQVFSRDAPVAVDVGCGKGLFVLQAASARPDQNVLGVEVSPKYARLAAYRLARRELTNGAIVCGDAQQLFGQWFSGPQLAEVHVYFPDPWWKKRHHRRRIMNGPFLRDVDCALLPGGRLHFWTDVHDYYCASVELIVAETSLEGQDVAGRAAAHDMDYQTHFERRTRLAGQPVYRAEFRKP